MIYNFIFNFFLKISLIHILESPFILFHTFYIFYEFGGVLGDRLYLIYYLDVLLYYFIIISNIENVSNFFLKEDPFLKKPLYLHINDFREICFSS